MEMTNSKDRKRVLVGMSGGTDSSAVCLMLQEQGYEVVGVTMRVWDLPRQFHSEGQEYPDFIEDAKALASRLGIEHHVADEREEFKNIVVKNFIDEYMNGRTPNPCVMCNPLFKFRVLGEWADRLNCDYIATGHYVRLEEKDGKKYICCGLDSKKDQSYFLWRLDQSVLSRCIFPLGAMTKDQVREYLTERNFAMQAKKSESMEVCFIDKDYRDFLKEQVPDIDTRIGEGKFVDNTGRFLGPHKGFPYYTVGQRKGLGIALGKPAFVLRINSEKNTVVLGEVDDLETNAMIVSGSLITDEAALFGDGVTVRIRYRSRPLSCKVRRVKNMFPTSDNDDEEVLLVEFNEKASAVTPGQSAVFYIDDKVIGGAYISSQKGISAYLNN